MSRFSLAVNPTSGKGRSAAAADIVTAGLTAAGHTVDRLVGVDGADAERLCRLAVGNDVDADGSSVGIDEAHGLEVGHAGFLAVNTPAERLRPEPAERRVIPSLHMNLNKSRCHWQSGARCR